MEILLGDIRQAWRGFRQNPGFTAVALLTLALGIGANTAIFSLVNGVLLKPLAFREPGQLVVLREIIPQMSRLYPTLPVNAGHFDDWRRHCRSFASMAVLDSRSLNLTGAGPAEKLSVVPASASLFGMLGVQPRLGRAFLAEEDQPGHDHVVILTDALWRRLFHADAGIVGRRILLDDEPYVVAGVLGPEFQMPLHLEQGSMPGLPNRIDLFKPIALSKEDLEEQGDFDYTVIARLRPGVTLSQALAELNVEQAAIAKGVHEFQVELRASVLPLRDVVIGPARRGLLLMLAAVGAVLLIVCVNLANLALARATARARESAIRTALGASRGRVMRQVLTENLLLALVGGTLGVGVAAAGLRMLVISAPVDLPRLSEVSLDARVLLFALAIAAASGLLFGLLPAWRSARVDPQEALQAGATRSTTEARGGMHLRELLVMAEVGLGTVLLVTAGLLIHSFARLLSVDKGFETQRQLTAQLTLPAARYQEGPKREQFYNAVLGKLRAQPGVRSAGLISVLPLDGESWVDAITKPGDNRPIAERPMSDYRSVSADYFAAMGIPLLSGRPIENRDQGRPVAVISEKVARALWPGENALGRKFHRDSPDEKPFEVIGIARDVPETALEKAPALMVYVPLWYRSRDTASVVVRTAGDPRAEEASLRAVVRSVDPEVPVSQVRTMEQVMDESVGARRFQMILVGLFAGTALLLAAIGIYGVLAWSITRRTGEIGVRVALGATPRDLIGMVLRQGLRPVAIGLMGGMVGAILMGGLLRSLLFGVSIADPLTMVGVCVALLASAALACLIPARRAMRVDPMKALRFE